MRRNVVEWLVLGASLVGIALVVGVLVMEGLAETRPPDPRVELLSDEARQATVGWIVPAVVSNGGTEAAQAVVLEASAIVGESTEVSELEIDFLPAGTDVDVAFAFSARPSGEIAVRLVGFRQP